MEPIDEGTNELSLEISILAAPALAFGGAPALPAQDGFRLHLHATVPYEALSRTLNGLLAGRRFDLSEGLLARHVVVEKTAVGADSAGNLAIQLRFGGSFAGTAHFKGKPIFDAATETIRITGVQYDLQSNSFLLQTAKWLFNNKIKTELARRTHFSLAPFFEKARAAAQNVLNKEWAAGIAASGQIGDLTLHEIKAAPEHISIRCACTGKLVIRIKDVSF